MVSQQTRELINRRLGDEIGRIEKDAPTRVALTYPSPYHVAMSSLGYQRIYACIQAMPGIACERVFLADDAEKDGGRRERPVSYESLRELTDFPILAVSVAYRARDRGLSALARRGGDPGALERARRALALRARGRTAHLLEPAAGRTLRRRDRHR